MILAASKRLLVLAIVLLGGCASTRHGSGSGPYSTPQAGERNPLKAQELTLQAAELTDSEPEKAEQQLREALSHDLFHGPAHNNLGVLYLNQGKLFEAANEFEWARKLMPGHPDPRMNLALVLERAGRIEEALATYDSALEVYPDHLPTIQALTRCQVRHAKEDSRTEGFLKEISLRSDDRQWQTWARRQIARRSP